MKHLFLLLFTLLFITQTEAQKYESSNHELGFSVGVANYLGDLSNANTKFFIGEIQPKAFRPAFGIFYRDNFFKFFSFRMGVNIGTIAGDDKFSEPEVSGRFERNLHFKSSIVDANMMLEWNILPYKIGHYKYKFAPYIGFGIAGVYYNPKAKLNGEWINLQPLGTEGQGLAEYPNRTKYSKFAFSVPLAIGFKANLGRKFALGAEFQYRHTFIDYLDDVSTVYPNFDFYENNYVQAVADEAIALSYRGTDLDPANIEDKKRGNSDLNDAYFFFMVNLSMQIGNNKSSCNTYNRR